ncbi:hypothetical protein L3556_06025 [Candidatus Synechococcus calcipolaris G9]|uniref:histidine kinase n=1 Tax=Candidatus Synechococcus calcipolaris G9 TaxID=1497997 RepID=A0ABT6EXF7_9SYNE|nr:histidine kinase dimerization/phospho-acceptor domain-containing protein [Candidatus Synechococcus calcipolaris]MDG2990492.1 hypothetical protein [Candidatus Synechococcus calcipolaris G9]
MIPLQQATADLIAIAQGLVNYPWTEKQHSLVVKIQRASHLLQSKLAEEPDQDLRRYRHDLRTPLTVILGYSEILMSQPTLRDLPDLIQVYRQGQQILGLIAQLQEL